MIKSKSQIIDLTTPPSGNKSKRKVILETPSPSCSSSSQFPFTPYSQTSTLADNTPSTLVGTPSPTSSSTLVGTLPSSSPLHSPTSTKELLLRIAFAPELFSFLTFVEHFLWNWALGKNGRHHTVELQTSLHSLTKLPNAPLMFFHLRHLNKRHLVFHIKYRLTINHKRVAKPIISDMANAELRNQESVYHLGLLYQLIMSLFGNYLQVLITELLQPDIWKDPTYLHNTFRDKNLYYSYTDPAPDSSNVYNPRLPKTGLRKKPIKETDDANLHWLIDLICEYSSYIESNGSQQDSLFTPFIHLKQGEDLPPFFWKMKERLYRLSFQDHGQFDKRIYRHFRPLSTSRSTVSWYYHFNPHFAFFDLLHTFPALETYWISLKYVWIQRCTNCPTNIQLDSYKVQTLAPHYKFNSYALDILLSKQEEEGLLKIYHQPADITYFQDYGEPDSRREISNHSILTISLQTLVSHGGGVRNMDDYVVETFETCIYCNNKLSNPVRQYIFSPNYLYFERTLPIWSPPYKLESCQGQIPVIQIEETAVFNEWPDIKYQLKAVLAVTKVMDQAGTFFDDSDFYVITKDDSLNMWWTSDKEHNAFACDFKDIMTLRQVHSLYYERCPFQE